MKNTLSFFVLLAVFFMDGCTSTPVNKANNSDATTADASTGATTNVGAVTNAAATNNDSATTTANKFVELHTEILHELVQINGDLKQLGADHQKTLKTAQRSLDILEKMSTRYGSGEITLFFPINASNLEHVERERLISFADHLSRKSQGRKVLFVSIGSASSLGNFKFNLKLAQNRSEVPKDILDKYLVNIPHEFRNIYGTGDIYSPKNVPMKEHQRYQHVRVIAVFDPDQLPQDLNPPKK